MTRASWLIREIEDAAWELFDAPRSPQVFWPTLILLAWLLLLAAPALAKDRQVIRDESGRRVGTVEQGVGDRRVIRDESGRRIGTVEPGVGDRQVIRDRDGKRVGTVEKK